MVILSLILFLISNLGVSTPAFAAENEIFYARVMTDDCYLYRTPVDANDYTNLYFKLPKTYFVQLTEEAGTEFFAVNYLGYSGYVKKAQVRAIEGSPNTPYFVDSHFRVYSEQSRTIRTEPTTVAGSSSQVTYVPLYSRNLTFIGEVKGERLVDGRTDIWYFCKFSSDKDYFGYVYSEFCDEFSLENIPLNNERVVYCDNPNFNKVEIEQKEALPIKSKTTALVIAILCVPALIFVFLVVKSSRLTSKEHVSNKEVKDF